MRPVFADRELYPEIISANALEMLQASGQTVIETSDPHHQRCDPEEVAKLVLDLYRRGLTEPRKLQKLTILMVGSSCGKLSACVHSR